MIYELRIYTAHPGKMGALMKRFRDHTMELFERHGIHNVGYWTNSVGGRSDELWYIISFESAGQRDEAWRTSPPTPNGRPPAPPQRKTAHSSTTSKTGSSNPPSGRRCPESSGTQLRLCGSRYPELSQEASTWPSGRLTATPQPQPVTSMDEIRRAPGDAVR